MGIETRLEWIRQWKRTEWAWTTLRHLAIKWGREIEKNSWKRDTEVKTHCFKVGWSYKEWIRKEGWER